MHFTGNEPIGPCPVGYCLSYRNSDSKHIKHHIRFEAGLYSNFQEKNNNRGGISESMVNCIIP